MRTSKQISLIVYFPEFVIRKPAHALRECAESAARRSATTLMGFRI
jgi:hypothetical protein